jgi:hypothetical protein
MDPDQTARMRRLFWIHAGRKPIMLVCRDAAHLFFKSIFSSFNLHVLVLQTGTIYITFEVCYLNLQVLNAQITYKQERSVITCVAL